MDKLILIVIAAALVACKVEESDDAGNQDGAANFTGSCTPRSYEELSLYGYGCSETIVDNNAGASTGSNSGDSSGAPASTSHTAQIARYSEYEPNNVPENANPVAFPNVSGDTFPGIEITGAVIDVADDSDFFILSPLRSGNYAIYLCAETCTEHPTDSMSAIRVIDKSGAVIAGNPLYAESEKIVTARLEAGIPYYVQILGFDTLGQEYPYKLVIID